MQKWEYMDLIVDNGDGNIRKVRTINSRELPNWRKGVSYLDYFNQLGEQGWEVSMTNGFLLFLFKRAKS